jgi:uncharacterized protein YdiU (UPF0061 family)
VTISPHYQPARDVTRLGEGFYDVVRPARFPAERLVFRNQRWADRVGLGALDEAAWARHFARFEPLPGNLPEPLALRYHGHQFGVYNPALGDGRGFLFAQLRDPVDGRLLDLGTKGSGQTPWSRGGDGRLTLKGGVREVLATEMLEALGVPTSKTFSLFETGEALVRGDEPSPTRSSVLVRLSHSHVRFGTFQRFAHARDGARIERLLGHCVEAHFPDLAGAPDLPVRFFREVARRTAALAARWMAAGFVHGVLNTDNMNVTGESFDYGPYRFLPVYDPDFVAAYFDEAGRYRFGRQPEVLRWNLERLAEALAPIARGAPLAAELVDFEARYMHLHHEAFLERLGVTPLDPVGDALLVAHCLCFLRESRVPFDRFFFDWYGGAIAAPRAAASPSAQLYAGPRWELVRREIGERSASNPERLGDPYFQRGAPVTMTIDEIERVWTAIDERSDFGPLAAKIDDVRALGRAYGRGVDQKGGAASR